MQSHSLQFLPSVHLRTLQEVLFSSTRSFHNTDSISDQQILRLSVWWSDSCIHKLRVAVRPIVWHGGCHSYRHTAPKQETYGNSMDQRLSMNSLQQGKHHCQLHIWPLIGDRETSFTERAKGITMATGVKVCTFLYHPIAQSWLLRGDKVCL